ncbi:MAG: molybdopterin cofactor-binding domain-containing protein [Gemmatimonadota bacterium]
MTGGAGVSRRSFLQRTGAAAGGLVISFHLPEGRVRGLFAATAEPFEPNAFIRIATDDTITMVIHKSEMGQGVYTSLPMLMAEELDADWSKIRVVSAPAERRYAGSYGMQLTGGSTSVMTTWQQMRQAGATARALLVEAAANRWGVEASALRTEDGVVMGAGGQRATYGELADDAATLPEPTDVTLKDPSEFKIIGTNVKRLEGPSKVDGTAEFSIDMKLPDMLTAVVAHPPVCGGQVASFDASAAEALPGVVKVKRVPTGVAVIAKDFWSARQGREALTVEWDDGDGAGLSTAGLREEYMRLADEPGPVAEDEGDAEAAMASAAKTVEAVYEVPYLAHAAMEPLNATAHVTDDGCDIWAGTQAQTLDQMAASRILGMPPENIRIHTTLLGGGFGRRANPTSDFVSEAVTVAKDEGVPVKTIWTREDDMQCGYYRPMFVHKLAAGVDEAGMPVAWKQRLVGQSIMSGTPFGGGEIDPASVEGAADMPYAIPNRHVELHSPEKSVTVLWWRSVGHTHTGFVNESFLDEVAHAGGKDPFELRRELLQDHPRHLKVLEVAAEKAGWGTPLPEGRARGIAVRESFSSYVAEVAEVSVDDDGKVNVHKVVCAIDCGVAVNPWNIEAQVESAVVYGLTAALYSEITLEGGKVQQSNFDTYPVLRMEDMPEVEVHIIESSEPPTGVGEPGVPPIAPAVTNAIFALTGKRIRKLPIRMNEAD